MKIGFLKRRWFLGVSLSVALLAGVLWLLTSLVIDFSPKTKRQSRDFARLAAQVPGGIQKVELTSGDGVRLAAWYLPASHPKRADRWGVVLSHGGGDDKAYYLPLAEEIRGRGFDVILPDLRGNGESAPSPKGMTLGITEGHDVAAAAAFLADQEHVQHIAALGVSMGGVATLMGAAAEPRIGPLVLESSSYQATSVFDYMLAQFRMPSGSVRFGLARTLTSVGLWRMGADWSDAASGALPTWRLAPTLAPRPVLFVYGDRDPFVHDADVRLFSGRFAGPTRILVFKDTGHGVYHAHPAAYSAAVMQFLDQWRDPAIAGGARGPSEHPNAPS